MKSLFSYESASNLVAVLALLYLVLLLFAAPGQMSLLIVGIIFLAISWALRKHKRWLAYIGFVFLAFGASFAIAGVLGNFGFASLLYVAISAVHLIAAIVLFVLLWQPKTIAA